MKFRFEIEDAEVPDEVGRFIEMQTHRQKASHSFRVLDWRLEITEPRGDTTTRECTYRIKLPIQVTRLDAEDAR